MTQREKQEPTLDAMRKIPGAIVSGGMIEDFREGWAKAIFLNAGGVGKGHYFTRSTENIGEATSACGITVDVRWLYGIGNVPKCRHCRRRRGEIKRY